jgi:ABC-2 type transport system permease protein
MSLLAVAGKDLRLLVRDRAALLFLMVVPVAVITIVAVSLAPDHEGSILLPVVNEDGGPVAEVLLELLGQKIEVVEMEREAARRLVAEENAAAAALVLPRRLSKNYLGSRPSSLLLFTDPAKGTELDVVRAYLLWADREASALADPLSEGLLELEEENLTGTRLATSSFEQNVPGFSVMFVLMGVLFGLAFGLQDERDSGAWVRLRVAPVAAASVLGGKLLARGAVCLFQLLLLLGFGHLAFGVSLGPSYATFVLVTAAIAFCLTGFSLLFSAFVGSREQIIPAGLTVIMIVCSVGGCWWPLFMAPDWLQQVAHATPTAWAMDALGDLILRERRLVAVLPVIGALLAYGSACIVVGMRLVRLERRVA